MILTQRSSAWLLVALQLLFGIFFTQYLVNSLDSNPFQLSQAPSWLITLIFLNFGLTILLALFSLWKFETTAMVFLFAIHTICPIIFFTDLTRNPYFTQIILLNIWIAFLWIVWLWESLKNKKLLFPKTALDLPLFSFFVIATLSWLFSFFSHEKSFWPSMAAEGVKSWIFLILNSIAVFYLAVILPEKWRKKFIWTTFFVGGFAALYGLMQFYGIERVWQKSMTPFANRPISTFGNPNFLSSYLLLLIPLSFSTFLMSKKKSTSSFLFLTFIAMLAGSIATMTRSTWVGIFLTFILLPLSPSVSHLIKKNIRKLALALLLLASCTLFWPKSDLGGYANPWQRVTEIKHVKDPGGYGPWHQRILIWTCCWMMVGDHKVLGKGWGLLELFYPYYQGKALFHSTLRNFRTHANNAHNELLEIWSQTGSLGIGIYIWLWTIIVWFGFKLSQKFQTTEPEKSILGWTLTASALGMGADNFFGNVSIHFAVPAFLFWWQVGLLFGLARSENSAQYKLNCFEWYEIPLQTLIQRGIAGIGILFLVGTSIWNFRRELQEVLYFSGFKISKTPQLTDPTRLKLESAWRWYPREVNTNYELANIYARLSQQTAQMGLNSQSQNWRRKAIWGYLESLRSNCGYDELYFNLAAIQSQINWHADHFSDLSIESPRNMQITEPAKEIRGSIYNMSRALAINPLLPEVYNLLGHLFSKKIDQYHTQAEKLYQQATIFFPQNKDFLVNLAFFQVKSENFEEAYRSLKKAMAIDPFYEPTRKNLRTLLTQLNRLNDPMEELDKNLLQMNHFIQSGNWDQLKNLCKRSVEILPESPQLRLFLANSYFELQQWDQAEKEYLETLKLDPAKITALNNLALTYQSQVKIDQAKKIYEKILTIDPNHEQAKNQYQLLSH